MKTSKKMTFRLTYFILAWPFFTLASATCEKCLQQKCNTGGVCTSGCLAGYTGNKCQYQCQSSCKDSRCQEEKTTGKIICSKGCEDGYCGVQCKTHCDRGCLKCDPDSCNNCSRCTSGRYGDHCQHPCFEKCSGYACDNEGVCLPSCADGRYGTNCSHECNPTCASCHIVTGNCFKCRQGYFGDSCEHQCPPCLPIEVSHVYLIQTGCVRCTAAVMGKGLMPQKHSDSTASDYHLTSDNVYMMLATVIAVLVFALLSAAIIVVITCIRRRSMRLPFKRREYGKGNEDKPCLDCSHYKRPIPETEDT